MTLVISLVLMGALLVGWHLDAYPTSVFLVGTGIVAAGDVLVILPYQFWKANKAEIAALKERLAV